MLLAAWRAAPALRERVLRAAAAHGCTSTVTVGEVLAARPPCLRLDDGSAQWSDGSVRVQLGPDALDIAVLAPSQRQIYVAEFEGGRLASSSLPVLIELLSPGISVPALAARLLVLGLSRSVPWQGIARAEALLPAPPLDTIDDLPAAKRALEASIGAAVDRAIDGAHRVGVLLSGGLDSSAVLAALTERIPTERIVPITWDLGGRNGDRPFVDAWQRRLGLDLQRLTASDAAPLLEDSLVIAGAPTALMTGAFERAAMRRAKALGADVLLTGVGGDESFAGSLQAAVRSRASWWQAAGRALMAEFPWGSSARSRLTELVLRPALRPFAPRVWRERAFVRRELRSLPALGPVVLQQLVDASRLHVAVVPPVPHAAEGRLRELALRPFCLEMGELRAQLETAEQLPRFDIPLDPEVHRTVASIEPHLLFDESRHRGLLRRVLQGRAPQIATARLDKGDFDVFGQRLLREANMLPRLRALAEGRRLAALGLVEVGAIEACWQPADRYPEDLSAFLPLWPYLAAEAFLEQYT